jgi:hypothetical protein
MRPASSPRSAKEKILSQSCSPFRRFHTEFSVAAGRKSDDLESGIRGGPTHDRHDVPGPSAIVIFHAGGKLLVFMPVENKID